MKQIINKLKFVVLAAVMCLSIAANAEASYDYLASVCVSHYADKDPPPSDDNDNAKWYSVYCLTQESAQQAMGTTDTVDYKTYAAWLGKDFGANKQKTIDNAQFLDLNDYVSVSVVKNKYYFFSYYMGGDTPDSPLSDALGVVFFKDEEGNLAYNVLANKENVLEFNCDEENGNPSSGWQAIEPMISDVTARQRYPWNGKVDITYTATNVLAVAEAMSMDVELAVAAIDKSVTPWTTNVAEAACLFEGPRGAQILPLEAALSNGAHRIVWDMNAQGFSNKSDRVVFTVSAEGTKK